MKRRTLARIGLALLSFILFLTLWQGMVWLGGYPPFILPTPWAVARRLWDLAADGTLWLHAGVTLREVLTGLGLGALVATLLGYGLAHSPLAERLLTDILGLDLPRVYAEACKLEHVISPAVEARMDEVLNHPATCPHGWPIPAGREAPPHAPAETLPTLDQLGVWDSAVIATIPEEGEALVAHLVEVGLLPGATVLVREIAPLGGPITVQVGSQIRAIGGEKSFLETWNPRPGKATGRSGDLRDYFPTTRRFAGGGIRRATGAGDETVDAIPADRSGRCRSGSRSR